MHLFSFPLTRFHHYLFLAHRKIRLIFTHTPPSSDDLSYLNETFIRTHGHLNLLYEAVLIFVSFKPSFRNISLVEFTEQGQFSRPLSSFLNLTIIIPALCDSPSSFVSYVCEIDESLVEHLICTFHYMAEHTMLRHSPT